MSWIYMNELDCTHMQWSIYEGEYVSIQQTARALATLRTQTVSPESSMFVHTMSRLMTKPTKWLCARRRQISLGIRPVWSVFAVRMKKPWVLSSPLSAQQRLIRLGGCQGWSESSLGAQCMFGREAAHISNPTEWLHMSVERSQSKQQRFLFLWKSLYINSWKTYADCKTLHVDG